MVGLVIGLGLHGCGATSSSPGPAAALAWPEYRSVEGRFTVADPPCSLSVAWTEADLGPHGRVELAIARCQYDGELFGVGWFDLPPFDMSIGEILGLASEHLAAPGHRVKPSAALSLGDYPGLELELIEPEAHGQEAVHHRVRVYLAKRRLYQIFVSTGAHRTGPSRATGFLDSFRVTYQR